VASKAASGEVAVLIPAYDAGAHLAGVLDGIVRFVPLRSVLVVDDGSRDDTAAVASRAGAEVVRHGENRGKGAALATGLAWARERGFEAVITLDADGQHDPAQIPLFLERFRNENLDLVLGARLARPEGMPAIRLWTNRITTWILSRRVGARLEDSQSGYRLLRTSLVDPDELVTRRYDTESEILIRAGLRGARFGSVPIPSVYGTERSSIRPIRDALGFVRLLVRSLFWSVFPA
jgi:glycosyltransferase involved in cell wall biosynthesis